MIAVYLHSSKKVELGELIRGHSLSLSFERYLYLVWRRVCFRLVIKKPKSRPCQWFNNHVLCLVHTIYLIVPTYVGIRSTKYKSSRIGYLWCCRNGKHFCSTTKASELRGQRNKESFEVDMESESKPRKDLDDGHRTVGLIKFHRPTFVCPA